MLSVIICSRSPSMAQQVKKNLEETIGIPFEILIIDNSIQKKSIAAVYNQGAFLARHDLLCFVHEDVIFKTPGWGLKVSKHLSDPDTGFIGLAGGDAFSSVPSTWSNACLSVEMNVLQWNKENKSNPTQILRSYYPQPRLQSEVVVLDGFFLCCRKTLFEKVRFDETLLNGFHGYDIDISLQAGRYYKNKVIFNVLIEHFSEGNLTKEWIETTFLIANKWKTILPLYTHKVNKKQKVQYHWQTIHLLISNMFALSYSPDFIYITCIKYAFGGFYSIRRFLSMNKHFWLQYRKYKRVNQQNHSQINPALS